MATKLSFAVVLSTLLIIGSGHTSSSSDPPSASTSDEGYEVPIVDVNPQDNTFTLHEEKLAHILGHEKCRNLPVSVISIAGDQQKEKSLLLNYILLYLRRGDKSQGKSLGSNWLEELPSAPVTGFASKEGVNGLATSLNMWSEPFVLSVKDKETARNQNRCVVLMETQAFFENEKDRKNTAQIFGLSSIMSSTTMLFHNLRKNDLQDLDILGDYGKLVPVASEDAEEDEDEDQEDKTIASERKQLQDDNSTPFQNLLFVIQDSPNEKHEYLHGFEGGQKYIDFKFKDKDNGDGKNIRSYFHSVSGFLMPTPGQEVNKEGFDGRKSSLNPTFVKNVQEFVHQLMSPDHLVKKRTLMGKEVTGKSLFDYFKVYFGMFKSSTLPSSAGSSGGKNQVASSTAKDYYRREMMTYMSNQGGAIEPVQLEVAHRKISRGALDVFDQNLKKEGNNPAGINADRENVINSINEVWKLIESENQSAWAEKIKGDHQVAIWTAKEHYIRKIGETLGKEEYRCVEPSVLLKLHASAVKTATDIYNRAKKGGTIADHNTYKVSLMVELGEELGKFQELNEKNLKIVSHFPKENPVKKMWHKKQLKRKFKKELKKRLEEADEHKKVLFKKIAAHHNYTWNLVGSVFSTIGLILTVVLFLAPAAG